MFVSTHWCQNAKIINLTGRLDRSANLGLESNILGAQEAGCQSIVLDFTHVAWVDSAGLGKLFLTYHHLNRKKVKLSIVNPRPDVLDLLNLVAIPSMVPIFKTVEEAVMDPVSQSPKEQPAANGGPSTWNTI